MSQSLLHVDFLIIGAGIMGLTIARELTQVYPCASVAVLEKENQIGLHASGRNSGVLHSGIYYKEDSLKASLCLAGSRAMAAYCDEYKLPINRLGKIIVAQKEADSVVLDLLYERALNNGADVSLIDGQALSEIEPSVRTACNRAIFSPETAVVEPRAILFSLYHELTQIGVKFFFNIRCSEVDTDLKRLCFKKQVIVYDHLFNTAGLYADQVAKACGLQNRYTMIPFKGFYYELLSTSSIQLNHLIYPVPDMNVPFLGVHFTKSVTGKVYIGPTALPALGREHYKGIAGIRIRETLNTMLHLAQQYVSNRQGFRTYTHTELRHLFKAQFLEVAQSMVPSLKYQDLLKSEKVGIRAQLFDKKDMLLVMDFLIKKTDHETHILNAVSPAFSSAFSFAKLIVRGGSEA